MVECFLFTFTKVSLLLSIRSKRLGSMYLTQKNHLRATKAEYQLLRYLTRLSKNLYNTTLYTVRQSFFDTSSYLNYELAYHLLKENENYRKLPSQVAQQTMKAVDRAMKSFFGVLKARKMGNYNRPIHLPRYLPKEGYFPCTFAADMIKVEGDMIRLSLGRYLTKELGERYLRYKLPPQVVGKRIKEVRIVPRYNGRYFEIEYVYDTPPEKHRLDQNNYLAIDLGLDNFATCVSTSGPAFILEGKGLKSYNRWCNKEKAKLQSVYDKQGVELLVGRELAWLLQKRKNVVNNYMNQAVNYIIQYCLTNKTGTLVIGELKGIKQHINIGRKNNQNFVGIPYGLFKQKLKAKCAFYGISYLEVNEAYSSQTCSNCGIVRKSNRKYRGLYVCRSCGMVLNADVNGAINILKQVVPESLFLRGGIGNSGLVNRPVRIRLPKLFGFGK